MMNIDDWKPADGLELEPNAGLAAKETAQSLALIAGPGAGKTEMLAQRADFLLRTNTCTSPRRILAISFKVDAATNLKERVQKRCGVQLASRLDSHTFHAFAKSIIDKFRTVLTGDDALVENYQIGESRFTHHQITFQDMVPLAVQIIMTSEQARKAIRATYTDVFLDEFQDCTNLQYDLVKAAFLGTGIRLTAVGDTKQRIMGWAGALDGIFSQFISDFNAQYLQMYSNFRSKPKLRRLQNDIVRVMDPPAALAEGDITGDEGEVNYWNYDDNYQEASNIANWIHHLIHVDGVSPSEIAVLVSRQLDIYAEYLINELNDLGVAVRNEHDLQDLTSEPITQLMTDFLFVIYGKQEPESWSRLVNRLEPLSKDNAIHWLVYLKTTSEKLKTSELSQNDWETLVDGFLNVIGREFLHSLSFDYKSPGRLNGLIDNIKTFISQKLNKTDDLVEVLSTFGHDDVVRILTIHKSKGLEFDTVVMLGVEKETFWGDTDPERCAYFVGVSRAKSKLVFTTCVNRYTSKNVYRWPVPRTPHPEFISYLSGYVE